jgi:CMP-N,N'-diacetyllegionaminic acid synthase
MSTIAFIPARANSIRLPKKNIKKINGLPLIDYSVRFAKTLNFVNDIVISTDDKKILTMYRNKSFIKLFKRPKYLSTSKSTTVDVILHTLKKYESKFCKVDTILLLQPTSPIRSKKKIDLAFNIFNKHKKNKTIVSVSKSNDLIKRSFNIKNKKLELVKKKNTKSFNYQVNGNFYIASKSFLKKYKKFYYINRTLPFILNSKSLSIDIDSKKDFNDASNVLTK